LSYSLGACPELVRKLLREPLDHGVDERASPYPIFQVTKRWFSVDGFPHSGVHYRRTQAVLYLGPDPIGGSRHKRRATRSALVDLPCKVEETHRADRDLVQFQLARQFLRCTSVEHARIDAQAGAHVRADSVTILRRQSVRKWIFNSAKTSLVIDRAKVAEARELLGTKTSPRR
jgi:hypothetical protein